jgi:hypothetical protein
MIKQITTLEHKIGDRIYQFYCDPNSPLGELHDALAAMQIFIVSKIKALHEQNDSNKPKEDISGAE